MQIVKIESLPDLRRHEREVLERIAATRNGGLRFITHPIRLLADIGFPLSDEAIREWREVEPILSGLSDEPYDALLEAEEQQIEVRLRTLFHGDVR